MFYLIYQQQSLKIFFFIWKLKDVKTSAKIKKKKFWKCHLLKQTKTKILTKDGQIYETDKTEEIQYVSLLT